MASAAPRTATSSHSPLTIRDISPSSQPLADVVVDGGAITIVSSGTHAGPREPMGFPAPQWRHPVLLADADAADPSPRAGRMRCATSKLANLYSPLNPFVRAASSWPARDARSWCSPRGPARCG